MKGEQIRRQATQIDVLPDDVLVGIFYCYMKIMYPPAQYRSKKTTETWLSLVHVSRRWRDLILGSPRRLNLQLFCTSKTRVKDALDTWPALPLSVAGKMDSKSGTDNLIAALRQSNRVCNVTLEGSANRKSEEVLASMQVPFPELTELRLISCGETLPVIPDSFLGGSAPLLRYFNLFGIPFPGLPNLLLSATHLVDLILFNIPHSGYFSPEAIVDLLSMSSSLKSLSLGFRSPRSRPDREARRPPPPKRSVIPALTYLYFKGVIEYLEGLVTGIDTPQLDRMDITFFNQVDFEIPRLAQFINRTPKLIERNAYIQFDDYYARVALRTEFRTLEISISCREPDWQLSSIEQVCNFLHPLSTVEDLYIERLYSKLIWKDDIIENALWLQLLLPFTAVKNLYLSEKSLPGIAAVLQELIGERITEVLPSLQAIFVERFEASRSFQERIGRFIAGRQLSDHTITVSRWNRGRW